MKFYTLQITHDTEGQEAIAVTPFESENDAVAKYHTELGYAMNNSAVVDGLFAVVYPSGKNVKFVESASSYFNRPVVAPEPEAVEPTEET